MPNVAIFPGTFDPFHMGHEQIVARGLQVFDKIIIAIGSNPEGRHMFALEERRHLIRASLKEHVIDIDHHSELIDIDSFGGLLVDYAKKRNVHVILRGIRNATDLEHETQMMAVNEYLGPRIETCHLICSPALSYISSRLLRATFMSGGMLAGAVSGAVFDALRNKYQGSQP